MPGADVIISPGRVESDVGRWMRGGWIAESRQRFVWKSRGGGGGGGGILHLLYGIS